MKKAICTLFFAFLAVLMSFDTTGQNAKDMIYSNPFRAGGVYYMYDFNTPQLSPAPEGFVPSYITHYGRHGARYLYLESQNDRVLNTFVTLYENGKLTEYGEDVFRRVKQHYEQTHYHEGDLSRIGWEQHFNNGKLMYDAYPEVFTCEPEIIAKSTLVPRCIMSMGAFCSGLFCRDSNLNISQESSRIYLPALNPHANENPFRTENSSDEDRYSRKDPWGGRLSEFTAAKLDATSFASKITSDVSFLTSIRKPYSFMTDMYNFVLNMQCTDTGVNLMDVFTSDELYALWQVDNYMYWVENGPCAKRDMPAALDIVNMAEADIKENHPVVRLRFGHDSVLLSILSILGVNGMDAVPNEADGIEKVWQNYNVPMGATFYLVFYRSNQSSDILFKAVLNGKEATLPIKAVTGPYYNWAEYLEYFRTKINKIN